MVCGLLVHFVDGGAPRGKTRPQETILALMASYSASVMSFASSADLRLRMYLAYNGRAYPKNESVLRDILAARQELAGILGYPNFAALDTADQMIGDPANVQKLLDQVDAVAHPAAQREYDELFAFAKQKQPGITEISRADSGYWS